MDLSQHERVKPMGAEKKHKTESYQPAEKPDIISMAEEKAKMRTFTPRENFAYRYDYMELPQSLKFVGAVSTGGPLSEIENMSKIDNSLIPDKTDPELTIRLWQNENPKEGAWTFGYLVNSIGDQPDGVVGIDTGWKRFVVLTIRCTSVKELYDSEAPFLFGHNHGGQLIPDEYKVQISPPAVGATKGFSMTSGASTSCIEIYPTGPEDLDGEPEVWFYFPLVDHESYQPMEKPEIISIMEVK